MTINDLFENGRQIAFKNKYVLSVQWGWGNYTGKDMLAYMAEIEAVAPVHESSENFIDALFYTPMVSEKAEIAVIAPDKEFVPFDDGELVLGYQTAE